MVFVKFTITTDCTELGGKVHTQLPPVIRQACRKKERYFWQPTDITTNLAPTVRRSPIGSTWFFPASCVLHLFGVMVDPIVPSLQPFDENKSTGNIAIMGAKGDSVRGAMTGAIYSASRVADVTPHLNPTRQTQRMAPA